MSFGALLFLGLAASGPVAADGGPSIVIVRADKAFPSSAPLGVTPSDAGVDALWGKDLISLSDLAPKQLSDSYGQALKLFEAGLYPKALTNLEGKPDAPLPLEARYLRALALLDAGLTAEAARELISLAELMPALRARCLFSAAVALESQKADRPAADVYAMVAASESSGIHDDAVFGEARMRLALKELPLAEQLLEPLSKLPAPASGFGRDVGAEALRELAQIAERRGERKKAAELYREIWLAHPLTASAEPAEQRAKVLGFAEPSTAEQVGRAELLLAANRNAKAIATLNALAGQLKLKPTSAAACQAHFALGKALKKERHHTDALREMTAVLERCTSPEEAELRARALYLAGQSAAVVDPPRAKKLFAELVDQFPQSSFADDGLFFAADVEAKNLGEVDAAKEALAKLVQQYPSGDYANEARFRLFWLAREGADVKAGADQLARLAAAGPAGAPRAPEPVLRARYWRARTASDETELADLAAEWPASYYGDLAREALGAKKVEPMPPATVGRLPTALHAGTLLDDPSFNAGLTLLKLGFKTAAAEELLRVDRRAVAGPTGRGEPLLLLALALDNAGDPRSAHAIAKQLIEDERNFSATADETAADKAAFTRLLFDVAYPRAFRPQIEKWATAANVPPDLLQGLMREESALDPLALSGAGAVGLCQLMPSTAKLVARHLGLGGVTEQKLQEPDLNIRLGAAYLGQLLKRYGGRKPLAVAAYNAGEGAVDRWLQNAKDEPLDAFVEDIPVAETRHYVKRVLTSEAVYRTLSLEATRIAAQ